MDSPPSSPSSVSGNPQADSASDAAAAVNIAVPRHGFLRPNRVWRVLHFPVYLLCRSWIRVEARGLEHLEDSKGGVLLINHQSLLDPIIAAVLLRRPVSFLARDSLFRIPVLGWILRRTYVIPISREAARGGSIRTAIERLDEGFLVGMFPEGTRSSGTDVRRFRPGFLAVVRRTNQPVYPVGIAGTDSCLPRGAWFVRPGRVKVVYGAPLSPEETQQLHDSDSDDAELCELVRLKVAACVHEAMELMRSRQKS